MSIGFFGLGNMGLPMALNLRKAGLDVKGFDLSEEARGHAREKGLEVVDVSAAVLAGSDVVVTMLPTSESVEQFFLADGEGAIHRARENALFVDCSTIAPAVARRVATVAGQRRFDFVDAPVSGGTRGAAEATLTFLVGGSKTAFELAKPLLLHMGKKVFHIGDGGAGQAAKLCNNMMLAIHMIGTSETLLLGEALGLDPKILSEVLCASSGRNWSVETYNPYPGVQEGTPASRDYQGGFAVELMAKDLRLAQEAATTLRSATPLGAMAHQLYEIHRKQGAKHLDFSSIIRLLNGR